MWNSASDVNVMKLLNALSSRAGINSVSAEVLGLLALGSFRQLIESKLVGPRGEP